MGEQRRLPSGEPPGGQGAAREARQQEADGVHISRAMTKLGARDRAQLVVFAYESGLVTVRERT